MIDKHVSSGMQQAGFFVVVVVFFFPEQAKPHQWMEAAEVAGKGQAKGKGVYYSVNKPLPVASILEDNVCLRLTDEHFASRANVKF